MKHFFFKGAFNFLEEKEEGNLEDKVEIVKKEFAKVLESRNLSFLIGSGCSLGNEMY